ncbi:MAG TPA: hypothetical protein VGO54_07910 [Bradyrhizobium sp.]|nr:hypothetical protein [Bradyrhizobium sp.]
MPEPEDQSQENRSYDWLGVVRTAVIEILAVIVLVGAFISYVNWSSNTAFQEFIGASEPSATNHGHLPPSANPVQPVNGKAPYEPRI